MLSTAARNVGSFTRRHRNTHTKQWIEEADFSSAPSTRRVQKKKFLARQNRIQNHAPLRSCGVYLAEKSRNHRRRPDARQPGQVRAVGFLCGLPPRPVVTFLTPWLWGPCCKGLLGGPSAYYPKSPPRCPPSNSTQVRGLGGVIILKRCSNEHRLNNLMKQREEQIETRVDDAQWIEAQRPLSHLHNQDLSQSSAEDFPVPRCGQHSTRTPSTG